MDIFLIGIGGFLGAIARFGTSTIFKAKIPSDFPWGTLFVNLLGAFLLGMLVGKGVEDSIYSLAGTGFMGAFTTFSTFKLENIQLREKNQHSRMAAYLILSYLFGILFAFLGMVVGSK